MEYHKLLGNYKIDLPGTAQLQADRFRSRFQMKPGYDQAVQQYIDQNAHLVDAFELSIEDSKIIIKAGQEDANLPIISSEDKTDSVVLQVRWPDVSPNEPVVFIITELAPNVIQLNNEALELNNFAFIKQPS